MMNSTAARTSQHSDEVSGPLVVLSNRLPVTVRKTSGGLQVTPSSGGLVTAMHPVLEERGGTWVGWSGSTARDLPKTLAADLPYALQAVPLRQAEVDRYYLGFSNRALWPLFHSLVPSAVFDRRDWPVYDRVNERFAEHAVEATRDEGLVWVHDYQLMRVPVHLRRRRPEARIAYFLHIPFPPPDVFRILPWARKLLQGVLAADVIGFHTPSYVRNFLDTVESFMGERVDRAQGLVEHGDRFVRVGAFPLGIDYDLYEDRAKGNANRRGLPRHYLLGVDRLDYTKGIPERLRAFERLLEVHPVHREKVVLVQLAVPSRSQVAEYRELKREVDETVGRINGRFATPAWTPIRYLHRSVSPDRLAALYRHADAALVTPLRDGMNLVAKEYVASQVGDPGVLVLSTLAGAAETMSEAVMVNPYDLDSSANAFHRALMMPLENRRSRMAALQERERRRDVHAWVRSFLSVARARLDPGSRLFQASIDAWIGSLLRRPNLVVLLAYDGTLARLADHPGEVVLGEEMREVLRALVARERTHVGIVSGRSLEDLRRQVGEDGLIYAGNHGLEIEGPGVPTFRHPDVDDHRDRLHRLAADLGDVAAGGAWVEEKGDTLTLHLARVASARRPDLVRRARGRVERAGFEARSAVGALEVLPPVDWNKGDAALHILRSLHGPDWPVRARVLYAGDDETDEDAFAALAGLGLTIRIGSATERTAAARRLPDPAALRDLLGWLVRHPSEA